MLHTKKETAPNSDENVCPWDKALQGPALALREGGDGGMTLAPRKSCASPHTTSLALTLGEAGMPPALLPVDVGILILSRVENQDLDPEMDFMASREKQAREEQKMNKMNKMNRRRPQWTVVHRRGPVSEERSSLLGVAHR